MPSSGGVTFVWVVLTRSSFNQENKMFTFSPSRCKSSLLVVWTTGCLGLGDLQGDFGGKIAVNRGRNGAGGMKWQMPGTRAGSELSPRGWQTGLCYPPACLRRHKCVSLRVR